MTVRIDIEDLGVSYGDTCIWKNINLTLSEPGLVSILGPNGVGKSTLMYTINKILEPTEGRVLIDGEDVEEMPFKDIAKKVAYVPQSSGETFAMTVMDTVLMGRYPHSGYTVTKEDLEIAADCLMKVHMGDYAMSMFNELSAGQHQRVMVARGLAQEPDLLMLDEPSMGLAPIIVEEIFKIIRQINESGTSILLIEQNAFLALTTASHAYVLETGKITMQGKSSDLLADKRVKDAYLGA